MAAANANGIIMFIFRAGINLKSKKNTNKLAINPKDWVNKYFTNSNNIWSRLFFFERKIKPLFKSQVIKTALVKEVSLAEYIETPDCFEINTNRLASTKNPVAPTNK